jgi:tetratricopeptide (TPR) repeat protein
MPLPSDRADLLDLAAHTERVLEETANADDPKLAARYALELFRLGQIRAQLGESQEAERLFDESAVANCKLDSPSTRESAAAARIMQSSLAMADGRNEEALEIIERMIEWFGGFPKFEGVPNGPAVGIDLWLGLLAKAKDYERLYEASGTAIELLDPVGSRQERIILARALARRASSADDLGYRDEAVTTYEQSLAQFDRVDPPVAADDLLDHAIVRVPTLLSELGREEELPAAYARIVERLAGSKKLLARAAVIASRVWLRRSGR